MRRRVDPLTKWTKSTDQILASGAKLYLHRLRPARFRRQAGLAFAGAVAQASSSR
jgi:hypothetical protein